MIFEILMYTPTGLTSGNKGRTEFNFSEGCTCQNSISKRIRRGVRDPVQYPDVLLVWYFGPSDPERGLDWYLVQPLVWHDLSLCSGFSSFPKLENFMSRLYTGSLRKPNLNLDGCIKDFDHLLAQCDSVVINLNPWTNVGSCFING